MPRFLSPEWLHDMDAAARGSAPLAAAFSDARLTLQQVVREVPGAPGGGGEVRYHLVLDPNGARVAAGQAADPDLTLVADYDTAVDIARGALNAQTALAAGRLRLRGALERVVRREAALLSLDDIFAEVRARTEFPPASS